jgi:hypothetical protein
MRIWIESGGDTGGAEVYASDPAAKMAHIDWDDWNDKGWDRFDELFSWLEGFGDVMPKATRAELLTRLQPDEAMIPT